MSEFVVDLLTRQRVMEVYPIVRQIAPGLTLKAWQRHAAVLLRDRSGGRGIILIRRASQRFPCGLCSFRLDEDLRHGRILTAEDATVMTTLGAREAYDALVQGIEQVATSRHCTAVRWLLAQPPSEFGDLPRSTAVWAPLPHAHLRVTSQNSAPP